MDVCHTADILQIKSPKSSGLLPMAASMPPAKTAVGPAAATKATTPTKSATPTEATKASTKPAKAPSPASDDHRRPIIVSQHQAVAAVVPLAA